MEASAREGRRFLCTPSMGVRYRVQVPNEP